jgi:hypothetical protein
MQLSLSELSWEQLKLQLQSWSKICSIQFHFITFFRIVIDYINNIWGIVFQKVTRCNQKYQKSNLYEQLVTSAA